MSSLFAFSYCSWGSEGKHIEVVCNCLLQWTMFCQNSPSWLVHLGPCPSYYLTHPSYYPRWWSRRMCALLLWELQNYNLFLNRCQQKNGGSHQKEIPYIQEQRRSLKKMIGGAKSLLEPNPIPTREAWRAQIKPCVYQENPQRLNQTRLWVSVSCGGVGK